MKISFLLSAFLLLFLTLHISAQPAIWSINTKAEILKGDARGVSIDSVGTIIAAPAVTEVFRTDQPYIWSTAVSTNGATYVGTGGDGKVFRIDAAGKGSLLTDLTELNVTALTIDKNGQLFAGTSPDGKVYKIDQSGKADVYFTPGEKYIWSLVAMTDGSLAVGSGDTGKVFRVRSANASPATSLLFDTSETHIISLVLDAKGDLYAGTDSGGLVLKFAPDGKPFGVIDSPLREVHELAAGTDGSVYALIIGESAAVPKASEATSGATPDSKTVSPEKSSAPVEVVKSRYDLSGAKTAIYRVLPDGSNSIIWSSPSVTGFSLAVGDRGNLLLGTSDKGRIYEISPDGRETLLVQTGTNQISTIKNTTSDMVVTSSNPGTVFRIGRSAAADGAYESSVLDAKTSSNWGRIWYEGSGEVAIQTRSGNTESPSETWSEWSNAVRSSGGAQITSPPARFLQWRGTFRSGSNPGRLLQVNVAYLRRNIAPEVLAIQALPTNVGLLANPPAQVDPNIELSGLDPTVFGLPRTTVTPRRVFQKGATSLQWTAEDQNGDRLTYDIYYKGLADAEFKLLKQGHDFSFLAIDGSSLADGRYIFRIVARDDPSNPASLALAGERSTEPVAIDNTPPTVTSVTPVRIQGVSAQAVFDATDVGSYINRAEYSVNGADWNTIYPDDGLSDGPKERYTVTVTVNTPGEYAVSLRVMDANGNAGTARALVRK